MTKRGIWPVRAMYTLVAVALVISLMITAAPPTAEAATGGTVKAEWDMVDTPSMEDWVIAPESMIIDFAVAEAGKTAYAIVANEFEPANGVDATFNLLKSTDHAATWDDERITSGLKKEIRRVAGDTAPAISEYGLVKVATDGIDPDFVVLALWIDGEGLRVFVSEDGGTIFRDTGDSIAWILPENVYGLAVSTEVAGKRDIAITGAFGIARLTTGDLVATWEDATDDTDYPGWNDDSYNVVAFQFSPNWAADRTVLAVTVTADTAYVQSGIWGTTVKAWNEDADFKAAVQITEEIGSIPCWDLGGLTAGIAAPIGSDKGYLGTEVARRFLWVWVNHDDGGTLYRVRDGSYIVVDTQLPEQPWITHISYWGDIDSGKAIAGVIGNGEGDISDPCQGVQVYFNDGIAKMEICCDDWDPSCKPPTGSWAMAPFYVKQDKAYAVALGGIPYYDESAWSWSFDDGTSWNQLSLIDTHISYLSDVAVSPDCNKTMLASVNFGPELEWFWDGEEAKDWFCDSVWYHAEDLSHYNHPEYNGKWQRTWSGQFSEFDLDPFYEAMLDKLEHLLGDEVPTWMGVEDLSFKRGLLRLAPEEENAETVYLVDHGTNNVYWNLHQTLGCWHSGTAGVDQIIDLAVKDAKTIYALGHDGKVAMSDYYGTILGWQDAEESELNAGWTIAVWGDEVLVGGQDGDVAHSPHGTGNFTELENGLPGGHLVTVAFDTYYGANDTIYAALGNFSMSNPHGGIYRWIIGDSTEWYDMGARDNYNYTGLVLDRPAPGNPKTSPATGGVLYASYVGVDTSANNTTLHKHVTGVARLLTPALDYCCDETDWDYLTTAVTRYRDVYDRSFFLMMPQALKICGCLTADSYTRLFAIGIDGEEIFYDMEEGKYSTVWRFIDCYSKSGPDVRNPADGALIHTDPCECENLPFTMAWDRMCDSCNYEIQFALDSDFNLRFAPSDGWPQPPATTSGVATGWEVRPTPAMNPSVYVPGWFTPGVTYYWRVRSVMAENGQVIRSWWSDERSFTVDLRATDGVYLTSPEPGATDVHRTNPAFTWGSNTAVDSYNWVLSKNADLSAPVDEQTGLENPAHTYIGTLDWDTAYYWKVTGIKNGAPVSTALGTFRTVAEPPEPVEPEPITTPTWVWVLIAIGAVLVIVVIVLIFRTRRV